MVNSILIIGNFGAGALEHQFIKHLKPLQWQVYTFDIQAPVQKTKNKNILTKINYKIAPNGFYLTVNKQLLAFTQKIKPLVTLVFKGMEIFPETIEELKTHTQLLCNYNPDHPFDFYSKGSGNANVKNAIKWYDLYGTYATKIAQELKTIYQVNSFVLPFGYDADLKIKPNNTAIYGFGFIGAYDKERLKLLQQLRNFPINVYGDKNWTKKLKNDPKSRLKVKGEPLFNDSYASYCNNSTGIFNFLRPHNINENSHNMRTFEVPGYGGLLIANRTTEQAAFFEEDKEAIYFNNIEELKDKLCFLLKNHTKVEGLKKNAYNRSRDSNYSYYHRIQQLNALLNEYI